MSPIKPTGIVTTRRNVRLPASSLQSLPEVDIMGNNVADYRKALEQKDDLVRAAVANVKVSDVLKEFGNEKKVKVTRKTGQRKKASSSKKKQKDNLQCDDKNSDDDDNNEEEDDDEKIIEKKIKLALKSNKKLKEIKKNIDKERERNKRVCEFLIPLEECGTDDDEVLALDEAPLMVKIRCKEKISRFTMDRTEDFTKVVQELSKQYNTVPSTIKLLFNEHAIMLEETPEKLNISSKDLLECLILKPDAEIASFDQDGWINVKFQSNKVKLTSQFKVHKLDPFLVVMEKYSQEHKIPLEKMIFLFDGEQINPKDNSVELELEDGSVVDVRISKK